MYSKKIENESYRKDRIVLLIITIIGYFTVFALKKADIINSYIGAIVLIFLYMYLDFNITNIYFTSKRTTFKIYIFMILEIMHFFMMAFSLKNIFIYFLGLGILTYLIITDEGKTETNKIYQFIGIYTLIKVIFALTWIFFYDDVMNKIEKIKDRALAATIEKNSFLGEYKERVLAALTFDEVNEKGIYNEIEKALGDKEAKKMIVSREVDFKCIKKYLDMAKSKHISCKMMDNLLNTGEVCLVVASDDALNHPLENPIIESKIEKIREKNLPDIYYKAMGNKLCSFHSDIIEKEIPEYKDYYGKIEFLDSLFGTKCPICQKLGGKKRG